MFSFSRVLFGAVLLGSGVWLARSRRQEVRALAVDTFLERPTRDKRYAELADDLEVAGNRVMLRLERAPHSDANTRVLRHIIGIERWGQRRLRVALGETFEWDEHHAHKPPRDMSWDDLRHAFRATRDETVQLARALSSSPPATDWQVEHNGLGPLSARAWLRYLQQHADLESRRIR